MIRTVTVGVFMSLFILLAGPPFILHAVLTGSVERLYAMALWGLGRALWIGGVQVCAEGVENIPPGVCIFAANHTSNVDPPVLVLAIPRRVALLAKKEVFRFPIVGTALRLASIVPVDRSDREAAVASVEKAVACLRAGVSYLIFPEGTRSPDGRLRPFKKGTFVMAIQAGVPVIPVSVVGAHLRMRKDEWAMHPGEVIIRFGPAVDGAAYTMERRGEMLSKVEEIIAAGLPEEQRPAGSALSAS
jgi:1-acyl-sn-glycerol-3-phosphate acyltransferase